MLTYPGGRLSIKNYTLSMLMEEAYLVESERIDGGPRWVYQDVYSIEAKAPANSSAAAFIPASATTPPSPELRRMLQTLLEDRFALRVHREIRQMPVFALTIAKGGPKLQATKDPSADPWSEFRRGEIEAGNRDTGWLAAILMRRLRHPVVDRTELHGTYDFHLKYDVQQIEPGGGGLDAPTDPTKPSLSSALLTQLGLKLEAAKGPVEILVVDGARKPAEN